MMSRQKCTTIATCLLTLLFRKGIEGGETQPLCTTGFYCLTVSLRQSTVFK